MAARRLPQSLPCAPRSMYIVPSTSRSRRLAYCTEAVGLTKEGLGWMHASCMLLRPPSACTASSQLLGCVWHASLADGRQVAAVSGMGFHSQ